MGHELKTPLNAVIGFAQLLARDPLLSRRQHSDVNMILRSGNDLLKMIDDLLEFSRIEAGQLCLEEADFSLALLLDDAVALLQARCEDKGLRLVVERDPDLPDFLYGDGAKLKQIIVNLVSNAVKYTPHGGITLRVRNEIDQGPGHLPEICRTSGRRDPGGNPERPGQPVLGHGDDEKRPAGFNGSDPERPPGDPASTGHRPGPDTGGGR
jgi:signal transduction histidine kinase